MRKLFSMLGTTLWRTSTPLIDPLSDLTSLVGRSLSHTVGTAAISPCEAPWGVLDPDLRVKGTAGLRVVDASALPYVPTAHSKFSLQCTGLVPDCHESTRTGVSPCQGCCWKNKGGVLIAHPQHYLNKPYKSSAFDHHTPFQTPPPTFKPTIHVDM